jgi:flagellar biosynthetic protein FliR
MVLDSATVASLVGSFIWPLVRIAALVGVAPILGSRMVPRRVRVILVLVLTIAAMPLLPPIPPLDPISVAGLMVTIQQVLIGVSMGFLLRLVMGSLEVAGQVVATQMGLGFATLIDPQNGGQMPLVSHFYNLLGMLMFLALNGHLVLIQMLVESFRTLPIGTPGLIPGDFWTLTAWATHMFAGAVLISLPAITSLMVVNLAFGVMTRASPQLNIFAVGFPITLLLGLLIVLYSLPILLPQIERLLDGAFALMQALVREGAG